jgi:hypothetical protein
VKQQRKEMMHESKGGEPKVGAMRSRRAMYWSNPERVYRRTRREIVDDSSICPKCKKVMELTPYTKTEKMWCCTSCDFKIPRSNVVASEMKSRRTA